ncbi:hypothetical protein [Variovorax sp. KK3]|uniref:hypothetical protein n=1 Tax=Variovorax sp. KK3 TaxID=1855728 RepID=UPI00097C288E|nr:hypothetical protein [Variovorax sp. KK3]
MNISIRPNFSIGLQPGPGEAVTRGSAGSPSELAATDDEKNVLDELQFQARQDGTSALLDEVLKALEIAPEEVSRQNVGEIHRALGMASLAMQGCAEMDAWRLLTASRQFGAHTKAIKA